MGKVLQVWQRTAWLIVWLTDSRYRVGNHSNRCGSLCSHDSTCSLLVVGVDTCQHTGSHGCHGNNIPLQHSTWTFSPCQNMSSPPPPRCQTQLPLAPPPEPEQPHVREQQEVRGMLGNVVWTMFTWLRACSTDLSPDLLTDPEVFSDPLTRPAGDSKFTN